MNPQVEFYTASDQYKLGYRHWTPQGKPRARIVCLHGIQSHGGWYQGSCNTLCSAGYEILFLDRRGSGLNETDRGHAENWQQLVDDVRTFIKLLQEITAPSLSHCPVILLSVSWGGKLAAAAASELGNAIDGLALLYPGIGSRLQLKWYHIFLLELGCLIGDKKFLRKIPLNDSSLFTGSSKWQQFIEEDELGLHKVTLGLLRASRKLDTLMDTFASKITVPTLMMLAGRDRLIDNSINQNFFRKIPSENKSLHVYPNAQHTLEFEPNPEPFYRDLKHWLNSIT